MKPAVTIQWLCMPLERVYYFPVDAVGDEGVPLEVSLLPDGAADLSRLPERLHAFLADQGMKVPGEPEVWFPKDGARFLQALVDGSNPYRRFRATLPS
jgi:hypothetical protein